MAFEFITSGGRIPSGGTETLVTVTDPRPYVVTLSFVPLGGCQVRFLWVVDFDTSVSGPVWTSDTITVDGSDPATLGLVTPVMPIQRQGLMMIDLISGTPGGLIMWDVFGL